MMTAAPTLAAATDIGVSPAKAVVGSEQPCISNCFSAGYKSCLRDVIEGLQDAYRMTDVSISPHQPLPEFPEPVK
jgi:hypothetical protein